jgi:O-acetyl-ADP-ribose deacetylase (regulator of RNase III)
MDTIIEILKADITKLEVDAIVNAANSSPMGGGGVDGAIHRAGGPAILEACRKIVARQGSCRTGQAVITTAGHLPAKFVIHTVGPVWNSGTRNEEERLAECYKNYCYWLRTIIAEPLPFQTSVLVFMVFPKSLPQKFP